MTRTAAFISRWEIVILAILSPLFVFPPIGRPALVLVFLLPLLWIIEAAGGVEPIPSTPLNGALSLFLLLLLASLYVTYDVLSSAPKILGVVLGIAFFFAVVRFSRDSARLRSSILAFITAGALLAFIGLLGTNWTSKLPLLGSVTRKMPPVIRGVPGQTEGFQPNAVAGALVMFVPLQFAVATRRYDASHRALAGFLLLITSATLLMTQSRSGYLSLAAGTVAWALWHRRRSRVVAMAVVLVSLLVLATMHAKLLPLVTASAGTGVASGAASRMELWSRAIMVIRDFPLTGVGVNMFRYVMPVMYPVFLTLPEKDVAHVHNHLLQAAVDLGIPGLIVYLALWLGAAALLIRTLKATTRSDRWVASGMASGMIAYFLFGTADTIALGAKVGIFFWLALALIVSLHAVSNSADNRVQT